MKKMTFKIILFVIILPKLSTTHTNYALDTDCPSLDDADRLSQTQLIERLTHFCRYDKLERPIRYEINGKNVPIDVYARAYIYFMHNLEAHDLQFKIHALLQLRFLDPRLTFQRVAPKRQQPVLGEKSLRDRLWIPHIFLANERDSNILGTSEKDILTSVSPDGTVIVSSRVRATLYCWMNLQKFPFDEQECSTVLESWMYNTSELVLHWEAKRPITFNPALHMTEYALTNVWSNETVINADLTNLRHGAFAGNYSSLTFTVHLSREVGFYLMDYFLPSILIVSISWVSFWLQADQAPPRIMLGTSTMLTFITLASAQGKTLPKVSYIKTSEIWFLGCTLFIFGSLVEFAFVNTIWRRKQNVDVKKVTSRHILRSTLSQTIPRRRKPNRRSKSVSNITIPTLPPVPKFNNYLTVHNFPITTIKENVPLDNISTATSLSAAPSYSTLNINEMNNNEMNVKSEVIVIGSDKDNDEVCSNGWTTLTPQEISMWIDQKARLVFPLSFLIFNAFFWTFVYIF